MTRYAAVKISMPIQEVAFISLGSIKAWITLLQTQLARWCPASI